MTTPSLESLAREVLEPNTHPARLALMAPALAKEVLRLAEENRKAYGYGSRLFALLAPQCTPLPDVLGVLTQLDNYIVGVRDESAALRARLAQAEAEKAVMVGAAVIDYGDGSFSCMFCDYGWKAPHGPFHTEDCIIAHPTESARRLLDVAEKAEDWKEARDESSDDKDLCLEKEEAFWDALARLPALSGNPGNPVSPTPTEGE